MFNKMKYLKLLLLIIIFQFYAISYSQIMNQSKDSTRIRTKFSLAIHGGAGNMAKKNLTPEKEAEYKAKLKEALEIGYKMLQNDAKAVDVVEAVIKILEDSPLFNAGKGSVFSHDGVNEMDAAIMNGKTLDAGAVANVRTIKNPISAAKTIMNKSKFVFLSGKGAEKFAKINNLEIVDSSYFYTKERWDEYIKVRDTKATKLDHDNSSGLNEKFNSSKDKYGTVGCVVMDSYGNLAAGTSTGGIVNKEYNRIGDSPLIGAGTYANNKTCAVSCTGHGEDFIKLVAAYDVSALMEYKHLKLKTAVTRVVKKVENIKGRGGIIAVDHKGVISIQFTTNGMFRGFIDTNGKLEVAIYK
jgi:L-asparaginase / beta-aspartyl-peptidase